MTLDISTVEKAYKYLKKYFNNSRFIRRYFQNQSYQKWIILISLSFILTFLLTPKLHLMHPEYKLGLIASKDVRAGRNFLVIDQIATQQKKIDEIKKVPRIYIFDADAAAPIKVVLSEAFTAGSKFYLIKGGVKPNVSRRISKSKRLEIKKDIERILSVDLTDDEFSILDRYKFSPAILNKTLSLIDVLYDKELISGNQVPSEDNVKYFIAKDVKTKTEENKNLSSIISISDVGSILSKTADEVFRKTEADIKNVAVSLIAKLARPNLTYDKAETDQRKQAFLEKMIPVYFQVQKDEMIIRQGEKIDSVTLDKLEAFFRINEEGKFISIASFGGLFLLIMSFCVALYFLSLNWLKKTANLNIHLFCFSLIIIVQSIIIKAGILISEALNRAFSFISLDAYFYAIPYAMGAMLICVLINRNMAVIFSIFISLMIPFLFDSSVSISILWFCFLGSIIAAYNITNRKKRSSFFKTGILLGFVNGGIIIFQSLLIGNVGLMDIGFKILMGIAGALFSAIIVVGIIPLFESVFRYTTDIKLLELADLNQPIFQQMLMEAPGTYHHSIIVGSMAEAASEIIGANSLLARVSGYYHDIGKLKKPQYFIENQRNGENRHDKLSPKMSSLVIMSHVKDGCELAKINKLGTEIINIIQEHHGTSLVGFFYDKAKKNSDPSFRSLLEEDFRYPGPKPQTKEAGLVLLADVLEASSRTLSNPTPARIKNLVNERIQKIFMDGQLDECELTLHDLNKIAECFTRILNGVFHHRIDYPPTVVHKFRDIKRNQNGDLNKKSAEKAKN